jgi:hypothetical protein
VGKVGGIEDRAVDGRDATPDRSPAGVADPRPERRAMGDGRVGQVIVRGIEVNSDRLTVVAMH